MSPLGFLLLFTLVALPAGGQTVSVIPEAAVPGSTVVLTGSGFDGGAASVTWPRPLIVRLFRMPSSGDFQLVYRIPEDASAGWYDVTVARTGGARVAVRIRVLPAGLPGRFDFHARAIEVTQGVRGDIPRRLSPDAGLDLAGARAVHVAGRRTIVRVYPAVEGPASAPVPALDARLYGFRDGTLLPGAPISPVRDIQPTLPEPDLDFLRGNAARSWNFVLPDAWVRAGEDEPSFRIDLIVDVNSARRAECEGCFGNNVVRYLGALFARMERDPYVPLPGFLETQAPLVVVPYLVTHRCRERSTGVERSFTPDLFELTRAQAEILRIFPLGRGSAGMIAMPAGSELFETDRCDPITGGQKDRFVRQVRRRHFPGRSLRGDPPGVMRLFLFDDATPLLQGGWARFNTSFAAADPSGYTAAHEIAHAFGLRHAGGGHCESVRNRDYPDIHGQVEPFAFGFDLDNLTAIPPNTGRILAPDPDRRFCRGHGPGREERTHDLMAGAPAPPRWTSLYTWRWMAEALGSRAIDARGGVLVTTRPVGGAAGGGSSALVAGPHLIFNGTIDRQGRVELEPVLLAGPPSRAVPLAQENAQGYTLTLWGDNGEVVAVQPLVLERDSERPRGKDRFSAVVAMPLSWRGLTITGGEGEVLSLQRSATAPEIAILAPGDGEQWPAEGQAAVTWSAADADGDALAFYLEGSPDGVSWLPLPAELSANDAVVDLAAIAGGGWQPGFVRVQASDGLNVTASQPVAVYLAPKPPQPYILSPAAGRCFASGEAIELIGQAGDWQEGAVAGDRLQWSLAGQVVATGESARLTQQLATGEHVLALSATNSYGLSGQAQLLIAVDQQQACFRAAEAR